METQHSYAVRETRDGSNTLYSKRYAQTFHSIHGAVTESRHVFLDGSGIQSRLSQGLPTQILEVGFGTGLNFLLTAQDAIREGTPLEYWALERDLIDGALLSSLQYEAYLDDVDILKNVITWLDDQQNRECESMISLTAARGVHLHILLGDAIEIDLPGNRFHAVYQDAFSPNVNPELWTPRFFQRIYTSMLTGARLATYSARRLVRDHLTMAGFQVCKKPGAPGKREMVVAIKHTE